MKGPEFKLTLVVASELVGPRQSMVKVLSIRFLLATQFPSKQHGKLKKLCVRTVMFHWHNDSDSEIVPVKAAAVA